MNNSYRNLLCPRIARWLPLTVCIAWGVALGRIPARAADVYMQIARSGPNVVLTWNGGGTLQTSSGVLGPFSDIPGGMSGYTTPATDAQRYFRVRDGAHAMLGLTGKTSTPSGRPGAIRPLQIYSINVVGYVNVPLASGFNLIQNPLNQLGNTIADVLPTMPDGTLVYLYTPASGFFVVQYDGEWLPNANAVVAPGMGFFLRPPQATTVTFIGEVPQGTLATPFSAGYNLVGSRVPQTGKLVADLHYPVTHGTTIYRYSTGGIYTVYDYTTLFGWWPSEPTIAVGEGFWSHQAAATSWTRTFSVNP